jgi:hypothetical protein
MRGDSVEERRFKGPIRGQLIFVLLFLALSILLISQLGDQTKWIKKTKFAAQPRLWPMIALAGMVFFTGLHLWRLPRRRILHVDLQEAKRWLQVIEYCLWFIAYVWVVPNLGYLISTLIFLPALAYRAGYQNKKMMTYAACIGFSIVVIFKSFLEVKIPGGAIYEFLPNALRSFFILNF